MTSAIRKLGNFFAIVILSSMFITGLSGSALIWTSVVKYSFLEAVFWTSLFICVYTLISYLIVRWNISDG